MTGNIPGAVKAKKKIEAIRTGEFDPLESYDTDIIFRAALCNKKNYQEVRSFNRDGTAIAYDRSGKALLIDRQGQVKKRFEEARVTFDQWSEEGIIVVSALDPKVSTIIKNNYMLPDGSFLLDENKKYEDIKPFSEGFGCVKEAGFWYFVDNTGNILNQNEFAEGILDAENFSEGKAFIKILSADNGGSRNFCIDREGNEIRNMQIKFEGVSHFSEGLVCLFCSFKDSKKDTGFYYLDKYFNPVIGPLDEPGTPFNDGKAWISKGAGKWTRIDKKGQELNTLGGFASAPNFIEGYCHVATKNFEERQLFINEDGEDFRDIVGLPANTFINGNFRDGLLEINFNSRWRKYDKKGRTIFKSE